MLYAFTPELVCSRIVQLDGQNVPNRIAEKYLTLDQIPQLQEVDFEDED